MVFAPELRVVYPAAIDPIPPQVRPEGTSDITFELRVANTGGVSGFARLEVDTQTVSITNGPVIEVPAGFDVSLIAQHDISTLAPGTYTMTLTVREMLDDLVTPVQVVDSQTWSLEVTSVEPQLSVVDGSLLIDGSAP